MKPKYKDYPIRDCVDAAEKILNSYPEGTAVYQKWTCAGCGDRVTANDANTFTTLGHHEECGHVTDIRNCNYAVHTVVGGLASMPAKGSS